MRQYSEAIKSFRNAIKLDSNFAESHCNLGRTLFYIDRFDEAELHLKKAIKLNPELSQAFVNLASIYLTTGDLVKAEIFARDAVVINSSCPTVLNTLGLILSALNKKQEANNYFKKIA